MNEKKLMDLDIKEEELKNEFPIEVMLWTDVPDMQKIICLDVLCSDIAFLPIVKIEDIEDILPSERFLHKIDSLPKNENYGKYEVEDFYCDYELLPESVLQYVSDMKKLVYGKLSLVQARLYSLEGRLQTLESNVKTTIKEIEVVERTMNKAIEKITTNSYNKGMEDGLFETDYLDGT